MNRVRFAPSPTGYLHLGGARTYVFNWLFARSTGGRMILRIDDTDADRNTEQSLQSILEGLRWLEMPWDEQHLQSERRDRHVRAADALLRSGAAYRDFTPEGDGSRHRKDAQPWLCHPEMRALSKRDSDRRAASGERFTVRFRVPRDHPGGVAFKDLVYRKQFRRYSDIEDFALLRSSGLPTYHLASTVDDGELEITHVIRGQDHLTNTFKHLLLLDALGFPRPRFGHLPLLLGPDGSKLSKRRHGALVSVPNYRDFGFLPRGFANYLALLGWSPKNNREYLEPSDLVEAFRLEHVLRTNAIVQFSDQPGAAQCDPKAVWLNGQHVRKMPLEELLPYVERALRDAGWWDAEYAAARSKWFAEAIGALRTRLNLLTDFTVRCRAYFRDEFGYAPKALKNLNRPGVRELLRTLADRLARSPEFSEQSVEREVRSLAAERGVKAGLLINGSRAALTGQPVGPSAFLVFAILGRERAVQRLRAA